MRLVKVAACALNQTPLDWDGNSKHILQALSQAKEQGAGLVCLPELCISGYGCEDAFFCAGVQKTACDILFDIAPATKGIVAAVGLPLAFEGLLYDVAGLLVDGQVAGFVAKHFLAGEGIHYEPRWFAPWPMGRQAAVEVHGHSYPLGDYVFECDGLRIGFEICEDAWAAARPGVELARERVDIILNPSASHFAFGKFEVRKRFVLEGSRAFSCAYVYANHLGNEAGRAIYDGGSLIASRGRLLASGQRFSYQDVLITAATLDVEEGRLDRSRVSNLGAGADGGESQYQKISLKMALPAAKPAAKQAQPAPWESGQCVKEEEFTRAVSLGLFDYLRKSRSHGFVVSLSGGADSSGVCALAALAVRFAVAELGLNGFKEKLGYLALLRDAKDEQTMVAALLNCVYQATKNSSARTEEAASKVAQALSAQFLRFDIDELVGRYTALVSSGLKTELSWEKHDLALQNIQARTRGPLVWLIANLKNALLLATSNRSEAAVGYTTMDGDTCGGLSPIAGIDKAFLVEWLKWLQIQGPEGLGPMPVLELVTAQQPTAELRPAEAKQTDEQDLMPYVVLDVIERYAIRDKHTPLEVYQLLTSDFPQYAREDLLCWVERFFILWSRNQWKRERYAPCFHLDDENLDPKTWCRFPILSAGFEYELKQLREYAGGLRPGSP